MTRPTVPNVDSQTTGWDATVNTLRDVVLSQPYPLPVHGGNESNLASTYNPTAFDQCAIWVNHTVYGWTLYVSLDSAWHLYSSRETRVHKQISGANTLGVGDQVVEATGAGAYTITLPTAASKAGEVYLLKNQAAAAVTVDANGSETIDGALTQNLATGAFMQLYSTGSAWLIIG